MRRFGTALALAAALAGAQAFAADTLFELSFEADKRVLSIGDELVLSVEVLHGPDFKLLPPPRNAQFAPFELKRVETVPPRQVKDGIREGYDLVFTVFKLGEHTIKPFAIPFVDPKGKQGQVFTDPVQVSVRSIAGSASDLGDIRPIKAPASLGIGLTPEQLALWILAAIVALALLTLVAAVIIRKRRIDAESLLSPADRALLHLTRLEKKKYFELGDARSYFTELFTILERYLIEGCGVGAYELTIEEFLTRVRASGTAAVDQGRIREVFEICSLAKFAKWVPPAEQWAVAVEATRAIVRDTRQPENETQKKAKALMGMAG